MMESTQGLASPTSPNTTGATDEDTIGSITKDFSSNFAHKFTPLAWPKNLQTPTPNTSRMIDSNMSSVTCMKHANFNCENETPMVNQTPMRDLNPDYQDGPNVHCPLSVDSQISSSSFESPPVVKVLSPATQFRLKRAVFESKAKAVKSPNRKQRAQNVTVFEGSLSLPEMVYSNNGVSPSCAIESELGDEESEEVDAVPTAQAMPFSVSMKVMQSEMINEADEIDEKDNFAELQYDAPMTKVEPHMVQKEDSEVLPVYPARSSISAENSNKPLMFTLLALLVCALYYSTAYVFSSNAPSLHIVPSTNELPVIVTPAVDLLTQPEIVEIAEFQTIEDTNLPVLEAELSAFLREATRARALYVQFRQTCSTHLARLQSQIRTFDAAHGSHLQKATEQVRGHTDAYLSVLGESVVQFHHQIDSLGIQHEWLKVKNQVSTRVMEYLETSGVNAVVALARQQYRVHAPIVQRRVVEEVQKGQQHTVTKMFKLHHFIKSNELLADEFY